jgi:hypothetical protein
MVPLLHMSLGSVAGVPPTRNVSTPCPSPLRAGPGPRRDLGRLPATAPRPPHGAARTLMDARGEVQPPTGISGDGGFELASSLCRALPVRSSLGVDQTEPIMSRKGRCRHLSGSFKPSLEDLTSSNLSALIVSLNSASSGLRSEEPQVRLAKDWQCRLSPRFSSELTRYMLTSPLQGGSRGGWAVIPPRTARFPAILG